MPPSVDTPPKDHYAVVCPHCAGTIFTEDEHYDTIGISGGCYLQATPYLELLSPYDKESQRPTAENDYDDKELKRTSSENEYDRDLEVIVREDESRTPVPNNEYSLDSEGCSITNQYSSHFERSNNDKNCRGELPKLPTDNCEEISGHKNEAEC